ncbi:xylulokinase [Actinomadura flavalba]|uniref:xylulokinase n=1 Tax=Actinomadura flavalba TaxID=1120938 RepID=UPI000361CD11|nr:xylulokinase [Actinomadura flavalba]
MLVAGVDSSTQSVKVLLCRAEDGTEVARAAAPHPDGTSVDPRRWWDALQTVRDLLERADAVAVAAQQHGMVALDETGAPVRDALLWNDTRSAPQARALVAGHGGPEAWADAVGSVPLAAFTVGKLRWLAEHEPERARRVATVLLPHDYLTLRLGADAPVTDRGDASGTGYWSPATGEYRDDLLRAALGHAPAVPRVAAPGERVGTTPWGAALAPGTGDNMGAALGLGLRPGDVAVSIGTSGTAYAVAETPAADASGLVAGFADATGRYLPLVCTLNAARVLTSAAALTGVAVDDLARLALTAAPGADGLTFLPYLDGERTPDRPEASGVLTGLTTRNATPANLARAAVEALLCSLADAVGHLAAQGVRPRRVLLIGGGAANAAVRALAPAFFGRPVTVPRPDEYVARGAARQAAWALRGTPGPPDWPDPPATEHTADPATARDARARYAALRDAAPALPQKGTP